MSMALTSRHLLVLDSRPMRFGYFYGYFWFSHRTGGGETSA